MAAGKQLAAVVAAFDRGDQGSVRRRMASRADAWCARWAQLPELVASRDVGQDVPLVAQSESRVRPLRAATGGRLAPEAIVSAWLSEPARLPRLDACDD